MLDFFRDGGWGMWPVLLFGALTLLAAAHFAMRAERTTGEFARTMVKSVVFFTVAALASDFSATFHYLATREVPADKFASTLCQGANESLSPLIMGSAIVALAFLFIAVGQRRLDARTASV